MVTLGESEKPARTRVLRLPSGGVLHARGSHGRPPVLFLHGVGGAAWSWEPQVRAVAAERAAFAWEARGHGIAARCQDAGLADYAVDAGEALDAVLARDGRPIIAAHSMGGILAFALAADRPNDVAGLFLIEPVYAADGAAGHGGPIAPLLGRLAAPLVGSVLRDGYVGRFLSRTVFDGSFADRTRKERAWRRQRQQVPVEYPRMMREAFTGPTGFPIRDFARELRCPVVMLDGSAASAAPRFPELVAALRDTLGERFEYRTIDGGHYLQLDRPDAVTARLLEFARSCP